MKKFEFKKINIDPTKILGVTVTVLGVVTTILQSKADDNNRKAMKEELKKEIFDELTSTKD